MPASTPPPAVSATQPAVPQPEQAAVPNPVTTPVVPNGEESSTQGEQGGGEEQKPAAEEDKEHADGTPVEESMDTGEGRQNTDLSGKTKD